MSPEEQAALIEAVKGIATALKDDVMSQISALSQRCDSIDAKLKKADTDDVAAERVAADSALRSDMHMLRREVNDLRIKQMDRTPADRDAMADLQSRADVAYIALGERAPAPMQGETLIDYACRLHRPLQKHSKKFGKAELAVIARDPTTFAAACDAIRADAVEYGLNPTDLKPFEHRMIRETMPGGHQMTRFVGNGTIFKQLSRPVRHVSYIGTRANH